MSHFNARCLMQFDVTLLIMAKLVPKHVEEKMNFRLRLNK
jgi:hypothetical protein